MELIELNGEWKLRSGRDFEPCPAQVPGCVHLDLLRDGRIPDPFHRRQEDDVQWVADRRWEYSRRFEVDRKTLSHDRVLLCCEGLDTLATLRLNGKHLATTDNMFRRYEFDVRELLRPGSNRLEIRFAPALAEQRRRQRLRPVVNHSPTPYVEAQWNQLRKQACNYGWDWGPTLVTCGIWRPIYLLASSRACIEDLQALQHHEEDGSVTLEARLAIANQTGEKFKARLYVDFEGETVAVAETPLSDNRAVERLRIARPRLWWPRGMGQQPLYTLRAELVGSEGQTVDHADQRIGLRTLTLRRQPDPQGGESFEFLANGIPFFAKGANWIPAETFAPACTRERYAALLNDAADANMNMLRVWGGGIYEDDIFYDLCDELGLCVWQDFMFACAGYPAFDEAWMRNVAAEAHDNVRRLRHHPCLALWCGNNEIEQGLLGLETDDKHMGIGDYEELFDRLLPRIVAELDPQRDYWPGSPHTPLGPRSEYDCPDSGDVHFWDVWHRRHPFEHYRESRHRFVSEFGFQSYPEPRSIRAFTRSGDRNPTGPVMEHHQRCRNGNALIASMLLDWFRFPRDFDNYYMLSQILQGQALKTGVEHWRRNMPRCMGALYWQLNDCWPVAGWSSIDYYGRWKALHYMARRFYAPLLLSALPEPKGKALSLHATSDLDTTTRARLFWRLLDLEGRCLEQGEKQISIAPRHSRPVLKLPLTEALRDHDPERLLLEFGLEREGETLCQDLHCFVRPKLLELPKPGLRQRLQKTAPRHWTLTLAARRPALWAWVEFDRIEARLSDNFIHVLPGRDRSIEITTPRDMDTPKLRERLRLASLFDTYQ